MTTLDREIARCDSIFFSFAWNSLRTSREPFGASSAYFCFGSERFPGFSMLKPTDAVRQLFTTARYYLEMYLHTAENGAIGAFSDPKIRDER